MTPAAEAAAALRAARRAVMLTGAGVSAESGIPTFRDAQTGLWARFKPEELATEQAFRRDPVRVWEWYLWRRSQVEAAQPNPAHIATARLERLVPEFLLITQNVDGLHARAGSTKLIELHGNIARTRCAEGCGVVAWSAAGAPLPPHCERCGGLLRPDVVWFDDALDALALRAAEQHSTSAEVFLVVGTALEVFPAAALPGIASAGGAVVAVLDTTRPRAAPRGALFIEGRAGETLPALVEDAFGAA